MMFDFVRKLTVRFCDGYTKNDPDSGKVGVNDEYNSQSTTVLVTLKTDDRGSWTDATIKTMSHPARG